MKKNKRIKKVFRNLDDCLDRFISQSQSYGVYRYTGGGGWLSGSTKGEVVDAVYFKNERIFSYGSHYLLGRINLELNGVTFSVVNRTEYSNSTSGHSWHLLRKLEKSKRLVIPIYSSPEIEINCYTSEEVLKTLVIKELERQCFELSEVIFTAQFEPRYSFEKNILRQIKEHNNLVRKFKLYDLIVKAPKDILETAKKISLMQRKASESFSSIKQTDLAGQTANWKNRFYRSYNDPFLCKT